MHRLAVQTDLDSEYLIYMHDEVVPFLGYDPMSKHDFEPIFASLVESNQFYVVENKGLIRGFYRATRHEGRAGHSAYLSTLAVSPSEFGSGLAGEMVNEAIKRLAAQGVLRVELTLEADNRKALAFYRKLGFAQEGTLRAAYKRSNQLEYVDELFLGKLLKPLPVAGLVYQERPAM